MTGNGLRRGENAALLALARGATTDQAGEEAGVSGRTVRRWLQDDDVFAGRVLELRTQILGRTVGALIDASTEAVATLRACLNANSEATRVRAATAILNATITLRESVDFEERLAALEETAQRRQHG